MTTPEVMAGCYVHRAVPAVGQCRSCYRPLCDVCAVRDSNFRVRCGECARAASRRSLVISLVTLAVVVAGAVGGGLYYRHRARAAEAAEAARRATEPPPFEYGIATENIARLRARAKQEPCDRRAALELSEALFRAGDHRGVLFHAEAFFKKCGDNPRLRWVTYEAHKQLSEWTPAADDASKLIASDPHDPDFRAWRGLVYEHTGQLDRAAEDFRQALWLRPQLRDLPINLANIYEKQGKHCEAILPLAHLVFFAGNSASISGVRSRILSLEARPECAWSSGEGETKLARELDDTVFKAPVTVNGVAAGTFLIDTGASMVVLGRHVAQKLQLDLNGAPVLLFQTANGVREGQAVVLDNVAVNGLRTSHVPASISDGLGDVDGLLGMSFLTRFELWQDGATLKISTRKRETTPTPAAR